MKGLSLFANVGIAETYLREVGVDIVVANELLEERARFYKHLYPECNMIQGDITNDTTYKSIIAASKNNGVEFIMATPPCQGMSLAGSKNPNDPRNYLIIYAINIIKELKPKFVLLENVPQQLNTKIIYNNDIVLIPDYIEQELGNDYYINNIITFCIKSGNKKAVDIGYECAKQNISKRTMNCAKSKLGIISTKTKDGWMWDFARAEAIDDE